MADPDRIAAALRYQQELDAAQRPATMNPNLAAQGEAYRANMTPPTSVMDPRYPAWKKNQDAADAVGAVGDLALSAIPMAGPAVQGVKAAGRFAGPELARGLENYMVKTGGILPMDTWHGSPHRFPPTAKNPLGEFDPMKIGTGEGAQAYGHGLYLAENPGVAKGYQAATSKDRFLTNTGFFDPGELEHLNVKVKARSGDLDSAIAEAKKYSIPDQDYPNVAAMAARDLEKLQALKLSGGIKANTGSLYKVDLPDEQIAKMLDWDKPLSQQPEALKTIRGLVPADMLKTFDANVKGGISGSNAYKNYIPSQSYAIRDAGATNYKPSAAKTFEDALAEVGGDTSRLRVINNRSEAKVSEMLRAQGIPGIRYLDQGSRSGGAGTSNFVVFDPKHMNIIGRE